MVSHRFSEGVGRAPYPGSPLIDEPAVADAVIELVAGGEGDHRQHLFGAGDRPQREQATVGRDAGRSAHKPYLGPLASSRGSGLLLVNARPLARPLDRTVSEAPASPVRSRPKTRLFQGYGTLSNLPLLYLDQH